VCPVGKFSSGQSLEACQVCPLGAFASTPGATECTFSAKCLSSCNLVDVEANRSVSETKTRTELFSGACAYHELTTLPEGPSGQCTITADAATCRRHCDMDISCTSYKTGDSLALQTSGFNCCLQYCSPTTVFNMSQAKAPCAVEVAAACIDDEQGRLAAFGMTCDAVIGLGCDTDLHDANPAAPVGSLVSIVCPTACDAACTTSPSCTDDEQGRLAAFGMTCDAVIGLGCDADLHDANPAAPVGSLVSLVCPTACDVACCIDDPNGILASYGTNCLP
jgi:hypothetical protein